ncbi:MAG: hypothetical protein ACOYOK_00180 [Pseudobdellovibrionaceae bacterium]
MKSLKFKSLVAIAISLLSNRGFAVDSENIQNCATRSEPGNEITLISRFTGGDYVSASYSFRFLSQDVKLTKNKPDILFEAGEDFEDYFRVNLVIGDSSVIYDLGKKSCSDIKSTHADERVKLPVSWLAYSEAAPLKLSPATTAKVHKGHCYLSFNNDYNSRLTTLFHVKNHQKSKTVTIDEIEVIDKWER